MTKATVIRNAAWVVAWNSAAGRHHYLRDVDVAFAGNEITHVGGAYAGPADTEISGRDLIGHAGADQHPQPPHQRAPAQGNHRRDPLPELLPLIAV